MSVQFGDSVATTSGFTVLRVTMDNPPGKLAVFSGNAHLRRRAMAPSPLTCMAAKASRSTAPIRANYRARRIDRAGFVGRMELGPRSGADRRGRGADRRVGESGRERKPRMERSGRQRQLVQRAGARLCLVALRCGERGI